MPAGLYTGRSYESQLSKTPVFEYYPDTIVIPLTLGDGAQRTIEINPGWAFGKGFHPTTKLCKEALEYVYSNPEITGGKIKTMLDVGCGSGILSLCAAALGARKVVGLDIDSIIVLEARSNVRGNGFESEIEIVLGSIEDIENSFDLVAANILIGSILELSAELRLKVKPGGLLLLSGIKDEEEDRALKRFSELGFSLLNKYSEKEWVALLLRSTLS